MTVLLIATHLLFEGGAALAVGALTNFGDIKSCATGLFHGIKSVVNWVADGIESGAFEHAATSFVSGVKDFGKAVVKGAGKVLSWINPFDHHHHRMLLEVRTLRCFIMSERVPVLRGMYGPILRHMPTLPVHITRCIRYI